VFFVLRKSNFTRDLNKQDLIQSGFTGLIEAANRFDPKLSDNFSTFAYKYIVGYILRDYNKINNRNQNLFKIYQYIIENDINQNVLNEIVDKTGLKLENIVKLVNMYRCCSLDNFVKNQESDKIRLLDGIKSQYFDIDNDLSIDVKNAVSKLPISLRKVIVLRYFKDLSFSKISKQLGISRFLVYSKHRMALKMMKKKLI
jgi:RNA polymerase sigma factor (sigma-70 family)